MKNDFTKTNLFSCPIYKIRIDPNSYDKEKILNDIKYNKSLKNTRNEPHQNFGNGCDIHHSYEDFDNENFRIINYEKLISTYSEIFQSFFNEELSTIKEFKWEFQIENYTAMTEGQWMSTHNHLGKGEDFVFATVHYLNFKKDHVSTTFYNPAKFAPYTKFIQSKLYNTINNTVPDNSYLWENCTFSVKEDDMIIFPATLDHEIQVQGPTKEPRITVSSNAWMR
jgi:hypothetical protein